MVRTPTKKLKRVDPKILRWRAIIEVLARTTLTVPPTAKGEPDGLRKMSASAVGSGVPEGGLWQAGSV